ncbi:putative ABC transporter ABC 2 type transporter [Trypanosoma vivax]|uniref:Putative ABC transporter n=1 Tax=Trypanosoma vivax (strain Y486) TaxID=1055687 RepID=G0U751_TRYVY|nr:putative ABC transporter [Trypanosoma vivax]KAH8620607.1 putative ABC transporter ABC 2 type transporter [Trypanosoma vivax]CCC51708.1 putative ABC transporter [Trypanosoma vivax Y486]
MDKLRAHFRRPRDAIQHESDDFTTDEEHEQAGMRGADGEFADYPERPWRGTTALPECNIIAPCIPAVLSGSLSIPFPVAVSWKGLTYTAKNRRILRGLSGTALPSRCLAVMGSSGAGKTTFLNAISDRLATSSTQKLQGTFQLGDVVYRREYRKVLGFVPQDDVLSPLATPETSFRFALRVRRNTGRIESKQRVDDMLEELGLLHCRKTLVGRPGGTAGLSGGERKRCSMGVELICDPRVLLLDEPTSGLDHVTSGKVVQLLNSIAREGRTVIYTIHQPGAGMLEYFDDLMLLTGGHCVYHDTMQNVVPYFESIGFPCPKTFTPTDFFMTLLQDPEISKHLIKEWKRHLKRGEKTLHTTPVKLNPRPETSFTALVLQRHIRSFKGSLWTQFSELLVRNIMELLYDRTNLCTVFAQALSFSLLGGLIFLNLSSDLNGIQDREGVLFMVVMNHGMGQAFAEISFFFERKALFIREQQSGTYPPIVYLIARTLVWTPYRLLFILMESFILYYLSGLYRSAEAFFIYAAVVGLLTEVSGTLGLLFGAFLGSSVSAVGAAPLILLPFSLAGGLFASTERLRPYWYWIEKPSFLRHAYILLMRNEMKRVDHFECKPRNNSVLHCLVMPSSGMEVMKHHGFEEEESADWVMWLSMSLIYVFLMGLSLVGLWFAGRSKA